MKPQWSNRHKPFLITTDPKQITLQSSVFHHKSHSLEGVIVAPDAPQYACLNSCTTHAPTGALLMSFLPASRTKRNLIKVASLGLAGLLAGLLAGCNSADASIRTSGNSKTHAATDSLSPAPYATQPTDLPKSIEATQIPALRHPPSARRVGSAH